MEVAAAAGQLFATNDDMSRTALVSVTYAPLIRMEEPNNCTEGTDIQTY